MALSTPEVFALVVQRLEQEDCMRLASTSRHMRGQVLAHLQTLTVCWGCCARCRACASCG